VTWVHGDDEGIDVCTGDTREGYERKNGLQMRIGKYVKNEILEP